MVHIPYMEHMGYKYKSIYIHIYIIIYIWIYKLFPTSFNNAHEQNLPSRLTYAQAAATRGSQPKRHARGCGFETSASRDNPDFIMQVIFTNLEKDRGLLLGLLHVNCLPLEPRFSGKEKQRHVQGTRSSTRRF